MGLDVTAYARLRPLPGVAPNADGEVPNYETQWCPGASMEWSESEWPGRGEGVDPKMVYGWENRFDFRAGSYTGYNW